MPLKKYFIQRTVQTHIHLIYFNKFKLYPNQENISSLKFDDFAIPSLSTYIYAILLTSYFNQLSSRLE